MAHRRATSSDVARLAGVSRTTVSFVLNERPNVTIPERTRRRVRAAARELEYTPHGPASQLAGGRTHVLGLVLSQSPEHIAVDALLPATLRGLSVAASASGFRVLVESRPSGADSYVDLLRSGQVDGLAISGPRSNDRTLTDAGVTELPIVLQGTLADSPLHSVDVDNVAGARMAVEHLIGLGHRRIACITNAPLAYTAASDRMEGYRAALRSVGVVPDPVLEIAGDFDPASGHRAVSQLLRREVPFTAMFVASDVVAMGAIAGLREAGFDVPRDVSVVGFDDIPLAAFFDPPLTTVTVPGFELGFHAGEVLLQRISRRPVQRRTLLPTTLVARGSTAPPSTPHLRPPQSKNWGAPKHGLRASRSDVTTAL